MRHTARRGRRFSTVVLAGWLFADMLLVLALVAMGGQSDPLAAKEGASARPLAKASVANGEGRGSASPTPSPTPSGPRSLDKVSVRFAVHGTDGASLVAQIRTATSRYAGRQAALVLTFGGGDAGESYAAQVNRSLHQARLTMFPRNTTTRDYLQLGAHPETAQLEVFFYSYPR